MRSQPKVVLVHGAWADGLNWSKVIPLLQREDFHVTDRAEPADLAGRRCRDDAPGSRGARGSDNPGRSLLRRRRDLRSGNRRAKRRRCTSPRSP